MVKDLESQFPFKLSSIKVDSFSMVESEEQVNIDDISFGLEPSIGYNIEKKGILIGLTIKYEYKDVELLHLKCSFIFDFATFEMFMKNDQFEFEKEIMSVLLGMSLSTMRGVIFEKTKGSVLQGCNFPIINPKEIINQELS